MTVEDETSPRSLPPAYRAQHGNGARELSAGGDWTRMALLVAVVVTLALVLGGAAWRLQRAGQLGALPPVRGSVTAPQLVPIPQPTPGNDGQRPPSQQPSAPPSADSPSPSAPGNPAPQPGAGALRPVSFEAESAFNELRGEARIRAVDRASAGEVIGFIGGARANTLRFRRIDVPSAGTYALTVVYVAPVDREATIRVNDASAFAVRFRSTGSNDAVSAITLRVRLAQGANSIEFGNAEARAPDIDRIVVAS